MRDIQLHGPVQGKTRYFGNIDIDIGMKYCHCQTFCYVLFYRHDRWYTYIYTYIYYIYLYIKRGKVSVRTYVRSSVKLGVSSSVANDVIMRMTS